MSGNLRQAADISSLVIGDISPSKLKQSATVKEYLIKFIIVSLSERKAVLKTVEKAVILAPPVKGGGNKKDKKDKIQQK